MAYERLERGLKLAKSGAVAKVSIKKQVVTEYHVMGDRGIEYIVKHTKDNEGHSSWFCDCPDCMNRHVRCKHIYACLIENANKEDDKSA